MKGCKRALALRMDLFYSWHKINARETKRNAVVHALICHVGSRSNIETKMEPFVNRQTTQVLYQGLLAVI